MSFRLDGTFIQDGSPFKIFGELVKTGIRLDGVLIYTYDTGGGGTGDMGDVLMANFKCNPGTLSAFYDLLKIYQGIQVTDNKKLVVFPQTILAQETINALKSNGIEVGLQLISPHANGAYTGQTSVSIAAEMGITHALIHYSEHTKYLGISMETCRDTIIACLERNIIPVICVGENEAEYNVNNDLNYDVVGQQLNELMVDINSYLITPIIVYEPEWAVGTGKTITMEQVDLMSSYIRRKMVEIYGEKKAPEITIAFGGTVNPRNAEQVSVLPEISGALVGGASLKSDIQTIYNSWIAE